MVATPGKRPILRPRITAEYKDLLKDIEEFYFYEADLLDFRHYDEWLDLITDDARYFMPVVRNIKYGDWTREFTREGEEVSWFDEGKTSLVKRVRQIETGIHWAEEPSSRQSHLITNVRITSATPDFANASEIETSSRFLAYRNRLAYEVDVMVGKRLDRLRKVDGDWKLCHREILLDQTVLLEKNITMFL